MYSACIGIHVKSVLPTMCLVEWFLYLVFYCFSLNSCCYFMDTRIHVESIFPDLGRLSEFMILGVLLPYWDLCSICIPRFRPVEWVPNAWCFCCLIGIHIEFILSYLGQLSDSWCLVFCFLIGIHVEYVLLDLG